MNLDLLNATREALPPDLFNKIVHEMHLTPNVPLTPTWDTDYWCTELLQEVYYAIRAGIMLRAVVNCVVSINYNWEGHGCGEYKDTLSDSSFEAALDGFAPTWLVLDYTDLFRTAPLYRKQ